MDFLHGQVVKYLFFILFSSFDPSTCGRTKPLGSIYDKNAFIITICYLIMKIDHQIS